jgi:endonuclease-3
MTQQEKVLEILKRLYVANPNPTVELTFTTPFELLAATILAAQATDKVVNTMTPALFAKYPTIADYAKADVTEIDALVKKVLFHNNKSKHIKASAEAIMERFGGQVPQTMAELLTLPGVARKTANVVLGDAFGKSEGIVVDTHMIRLSNKLGLTTNSDPVKIEQDLMKIVPMDKWRDFGHLLTLHGRYVCKAKPHSCENCPLGDLCPDFAPLT